MSPRARTLLEASEVFWNRPQALQVKTLQGLKRWIPLEEEEGEFLYVRYTAYSTESLRGIVRYSVRNTVIQFPYMLGPSEWSGIIGGSLNPGGMLASRFN